MNIFIVFILLTFSSLHTNCEKNICESCLTINCTCSLTVDGHELHFPNKLRPVIKILVQNQDYVSIRCLKVSHTPQDRYYLLGNINLGSMKQVDFSICALPIISFGDLLLKMGIKVTETFKFRGELVLSLYHGNSLKRKHMKGLSDVTALDLSWNGLTHVPKDLLQEFPNLINLTLESNYLQKLSKNFFKPVPKIERIELKSNKFNSFKDDTFTNLTGLKTLDLHHNKLKTLSSKIFTGLVNIQILDLSDNELETLPPDVFQDTEQLITLNLSHNNFSSIFEELLFPISSTLVFLSLNNNKQRLSFPNYFFSNQKKLKEVDLSQNKLILIPENIFWNCSSLQKIDLQGNFLKFIPQELFRDQINLICLDLCSNHLEYISNRPFKNLSKLETLCLSNNRLEILPGDVFQGLDNLKIVGLNNNQIKYLGDCFSSFFLPKLEELNLENNRLGRLSSGMFQFLNSTKKINSLKLHNNPWICDCSARGLLSILQSKKHEIPYLENVVCASTKKPLLNVTESDLCSVSYS